MSVLHIVFQRGIRCSSCPTSLPVNGALVWQVSGKSHCSNSDDTHYRMPHLMTPMKTDSAPVPDRRVTLSDMGKMTRSCSAEKGGKRDKADCCIEISFQNTLTKAKQAGAIITACHNVVAVQCDSRPKFLCICQHRGSVCRCTSQKHAKIV
jgi:hypothetical protein